MDVSLKFYSDGFQWELEQDFIPTADRWLWYMEWLWFEFEIVRYYKKGAK